MSISYKTPSYFSSFSCLGSDCEDTCCRNWEVKLDREHYDNLSDAMLKDHNEKAMFEQYIHLNESPISSDHDYAFISMSVNGYCAMLDEKSLCSIHVKHGVAALGNVCTMFPRFISRCEDTIELSGALSCPEVVRNCIDNKTPLKLTRFRPSELPRSKNYPIQRELSIDDDPYSQNFKDVREKMMQVMADERHDFETRLYVIANLANKISSFYYRGCENADSQQLDSTLTSLTSDDFISKLDAVVKDIDTNLPISMIVVHSVLLIKLQQSGSENISRLYQQIIDKLDVTDDNGAEAISERMNGLSENISLENKAYIEKALTRYIVNCMYREWFVNMPNPFIYFQMLLIRITILRSLIYLDIMPNKNIEQRELKQRIVYIMYNFARNIDQNLDFLKVVYDALSEQTMMNFDFSPAFIRFY